MTLKHVDVVHKIRRL